MPSTEEIVTSKTNSETETQKQSMKESSVSFENELANNPTISTTSESKKVRLSIPLKMKILN